MWNYLLWYKFIKYAENYETSPKPFSIFQQRSLGGALMGQPAKDFATDRAHKQINPKTNTCSAFWLCWSADNLLKARWVQMLTPVLLGSILSRKLEISFYFFWSWLPPMPYRAAVQVSARRSRHTLGCPNNYSLVLWGADRPLASKLNAWLRHHKPCMA